MNLELRTEYWDDAEARNAFKSFIHRIHGLDFTEWESRGYWDRAYTPFTFFKGNRVIASVCIYLLEAVIQGKSTHLVQISGVGTHLDWRRKGLSRQLTNVGLDWARNRHEGVFLFADQEAIPYYEKCEFTPISESREYVSAYPTERKPGLNHLDVTKEADLDRIFSFAQNRSPVSNIFSILNPKLLMFHALYTMRTNIYEIPDLNCLVFMGRKEGVLQIYDILGEEIPSLKRLYPYLCDTSDLRIEFHFHTDKLGLKSIESHIINSNHTFIKGSFPLDKPAFPFTSHA